ncbi:uncharacterized protein MEPE_00927 [Melanopsichium pennsylvanicum]|uniref:Uncharacterized protein n=2 Tax=Melanopsichium pennsylvanicum TaxID=63383 RepID=A0AAJ4XHQ7_9BASI|nr:conserved hypothetical protein [Melanopsichium pennsylvanicum 4]SNX82221.1 uncharacterized protein MEPE_00927 [Melanopsichium pennsylvanicum]
MASSSRTTLQPLTGEQQESLIKQRMQVDERSLRRLFKKLTMLLSCRDAELISSSRLSFKADLESFRLQLLRLSSISHSTSQVEISSYREELSEIELEQRKTQHRIVALKRRLQDVRRERKNKLEYDVVAGEIVKLPTRNELEESLERLREQLEGVRSEREKYNELAKGAGKRMETVITGLEGLRNDVGYEVGERERREVERADGEGDIESHEVGAAGAADDEVADSGKRRNRKASEEEPEDDEEAEEGESVAINRDGSSAPFTSARAVTEETAPAIALNASAVSFKPASASASGGGRRKRDSTAVTGSDEEGEVGDTNIASNGNTPRKRQRTEEGEVVGGGVDSEEEEGSILPSATAAPVESGGGVRAGTKRRR